MSDVKHVISERRFQICLNVIVILLSTFMGWITARWQFNRDETTHKHAIARLIASSIGNDLSYIVGVTEGIRERMLKKKYSLDATYFRLLYHPSVTLPENADIAMFERPIINAFDEYKRMLMECDGRRQEHTQALQNQPNDSIKSTLFVYLVGLDSYILRGIKLLKEIDNYYPMTNPLSKNIPIYTPLQTFIDPIVDAINEPALDILKTQQATNISQNATTNKNAPKTILSNSVSSGRN